jgi:hypothetical protein
MTQSEKIALVMSAIRADSEIPAKVLPIVEIAVSEVLSILDSLRRIATALEKGISS